ncbi:hypothetical protein J3Q64DRAFT_1695271 [Phycomyces blakesleeanus]
MKERLVWNFLVKVTISNVAASMGQGEEPEARPVNEYWRRHRNGSRREMRALLAIYFCCQFESGGIGRLGDQSKRKQKWTRIDEGVIKYCGGRRGDESPLEAAVKACVKKEDMVVSGALTRAWTLRDNVGRWCGSDYVRNWDLQTSSRSGYYTYKCMWQLFQGMKEYEQGALSSLEYERTTLWEQEEQPVIQIFGVMAVAIAVILKMVL